jgi:hypothetical protein
MNLRSNIVFKSSNGDQNTLMMCLSADILEELLEQYPKTAKSLRKTSVERRAYFQKVSMLIKKFRSKNRKDIIRSSRIKEEVEVTNQSDKTGKMRIIIKSHQMKSLIMTSKEGKTQLLKQQELLRLSL